MNYQLVKADAAVCSEIDPELFFSQENEPDSSKSVYVNARIAKHFCATCPLTLMCLTTAVKNKEDFGIWGGSTPRERTHLTSAASREAFVTKLKQQFTTLESRRRR